MGPINEPNYTDKFVFYVHVMFNNGYLCLTCREPDDSVLEVKRSVSHKRHNSEYSRNVYPRSAPYKLQEAYNCKAIEIFCFAVSAWFLFFLHFSLRPYMPTSLTTMQLDNLYLLWSSSSVKWSVCKFTLLNCLDQL